MFPKHYLLVSSVLEYQKLKADYLQKKTEIDYLLKHEWMADDLEKRKEAFKSAIEMLEEELARISSESYPDQQQKT